MTSKRKVIKAAKRHLNAKSVTVHFTFKDGTKPWLTDKTFRKRIREGLAKLLYKHLPHR